MPDKQLDEMTDQELADYLQAHKDDEEQWADLPPLPKSKQRKSRELSAAITVRFTPGELESITAESRRLGLPYSEIVRRAVQHLVRPVSLDHEVQSA